MDTLTPHPSPLSLPLHPSPRVTDSAPGGPPGAEHRRAWDAIPWVVAGAASAEDSHVVSAHLPHCSECQAEWALQQRVHAGLQACAPAQLPDPGPALAKLMAQLDKGEAADAALMAPRMLHPPPASPWTRWLVAAVVVQAIGLGATGLALVERQAPAGALEGEYQTLSQPADLRQAATLRLVLAPGMDFSQLRLLLAQTRMVAVEVGADGNSLGLAAADGDPRTVSAALPVLRAAASVILAEPLARQR